MEDEVDLSSPRRFSFSSIHTNLTMRPESYHSGFSNPESLRPLQLAQEQHGVPAPPAPIPMKQSSRKSKFHEILRSASSSLGKIGRYAPLQGPRGHEAGRNNEEGKHAFLDSPADDGAYKELGVGRDEVDGDDDMFAKYSTETTLRFKHSLLTDPPKKTFLRIVRRDETSGLAGKAALTSHWSS